MIIEFKSSSCVIVAFVTLIKTTLEGLSFYCKIIAEEIDDYDPCVLPSVHDSLQQNSHQHTSTDSNNQY